MDYQDLMPYGWSRRDGDVLPLSIVVAARFDAESVPGPEPIERYLPATALAVEALAVRLFGDVERARELLAELVRSRGRSEAEDREEYWRHPLREYLRPGLVLVGPILRDLRASVDTPDHPFWCGSVSLHGPDFRRQGVYLGPAVVGLECVGVEFIPGSLTSRLKVIGSGASVLLTLAIGIASTGPASELYKEARNRHAISQELRTRYGDQECVAIASLQVDPKALMAASTAAFSPGFDEYGKRGSLCLIQIALDLAGYPVGPIDGVMGPRTRSQLEAFAKKHGLPADLKDEGLRRALVASLHDGVQRLARQ